MDEVYAVPWKVERIGRGRLRLRNASQEPLRQVWASPLGPALMEARLPRTIPPGSSLLVDVRGQDLAWSTLLIVRWRRASGEEYLWRVAF